MYQVIRRNAVLIVVMVVVFQAAILASAPSAWAQTPEPLPHDCNGFTPPGEPVSSCCMAGYVYHDGKPVDGVEVLIESA
jgi:hypothetical protein